MVVVVVTTVVPAPRLLERVKGPMLVSDMRRNEELVSDELGFVYRVESLIFCEWESRR